MPQLEDVFREKMSSNPPNQHVGRDGRQVVNAFTWPSTYNINTAHSQLNSGPNAYGIVGANTVVGDMVPVAMPGESQFGSGGRA